MEVHKVIILSSNVIVIVNIDTQFIKLSRPKCGPNGAWISVRF